MAKKGYKKKYSNSEKYNYYEGISTAMGDASFCKTRKDADDLLKTRYKLKKMCKDRKDKDGVSFQNGYIGWVKFKKMQNSIRETGKYNGKW